MNLLQQPPLAGDSGSQRIHEVKNEERRGEDRGEEEVMLRQLGRRKTNVHM